MAAHALPLQTIGPGQLELIKPLWVQLAAKGDEVEAGWIEANIYASGESDHAAVQNLVSLLTDVFEMLEGLGQDGMGPAVTRQWEVLSEFIRRRK